MHARLYDRLRRATAEASRPRSAFGQAHAYLGFGNGAFAAPISFPTGVDAQDLAVADFDGDGRDDFTVANQGSDDLSVFRSGAP